MFDAADNNRGGGGGGDWAIKAACTTSLHIWKDETLSPMLVSLNINNDAMYSFVADVGAAESFDVNHQMQIAARQFPAAWEEADGIIPSVNRLEEAAKGKQPFLHVISTIQICIHPEHRIAHVDRVWLDLVTTKTHFAQAYDHKVYGDVSIDSAGIHLRDSAPRILALLVGFMATEEVENPFSMVTRIVRNKGKSV